MNSNWRLFPETMTKAEWEKVLSESKCTYRWSHIPSHKAFVCARLLIRAGVTDCWNSHSLWSGYAPQIHETSIVCTPFIKTPSGSTLVIDAMRNTGVKVIGGGAGDNTMQVGWYVDHGDTLQSVYDGLAMIPAIIRAMFDELKRGNDEWMDKY